MFSRSLLHSQNICHSNDRDPKLQRRIHSTVSIGWPKGNTEIHLILSLSHWDVSISGLWMSRVYSSCEKWKLQILVSLIHDPFGGTTVKQHRRTNFEIILMTQILIGWKKWLTKCIRQEGSVIVLPRRGKIRQFQKGKSGKTNSGSGVSDSVDEWLSLQWCIYLEGIETYCFQSNDSQNPRIAEGGRDLRVPQAQPLL